MTAGVELQIVAHLRPRYHCTATALQKSIGHRAPPIHQDWLHQSELDTGTFLLPQRVLAEMSLRTARRQIDLGCCYVKSRMRPLTDSTRLIQFVAHRRYTSNV